MSYIVKNQIRSYFSSVFSCIRTEQYLSVFSPNAGKYGREITPYLDTFHAVKVYCSDYELIQIICSDSEFCSDTGKPNDSPLYVNANSNHLPNILKQLPTIVNTVSRYYPSMKMNSIKQNLYMKRF